MIHLDNDGRTLGFATKFEKELFMSKRQEAELLAARIAEFQAKGGEIQKFSMGERGNDTFCFSRNNFGNIYYLKDEEGERIRHNWDLPANNFFDSSLTTNNNRIYGQCSTPGCNGRKVVYYPDTATRNVVEARVNPAFPRSPLERL